MLNSRLSVPGWLVVSVGTLLLVAGMAETAQAQVGQASALFLRVAPDSRAAGMGNTGVAVADNANAMYWNPAGLGFQENTQVGITHSNWLPEFNAGLFYEYLVGVHHVEGIGTFGANVRFLDLGTTERTDADGNTLGESNPFELAIGTSYARQIGNFSVGTSVRFIRSKLTDPSQELGISDGSASTVAFDIAGMYRSSPFKLGGTDATFSMGLNISNLGPPLDFEDRKVALGREEPDGSVVATGDSLNPEDPIPSTFRVGPALTLDFDEFNSLTIATDLTKSLVSSDQFIDDEGNVISDGNSGFSALVNSWGTERGRINEAGEAESLGLLQQFTVGSGLEYWYRDLFALRTGYFYEHPDNGDRQFVTFGAGLRYNIVGIDVSYLFSDNEDSPLANTLRFSLLLDFQ